MLWRHAQGDNPWIPRTREKFLSRTEIGVDGSCETGVWERVRDQITVYFLPCSSCFVLIYPLAALYVFNTTLYQSSEVLWVGEDSVDKPSSIQEAFARRKKSGLSDSELNKRHRRVSVDNCICLLMNPYLSLFSFLFYQTMKKAAAADTGPFTASSWEW
jgi:hypothetical protein